MDYTTEKRKPAKPGKKWYANREKTARLSEGLMSAL
jgi:hypothetical protein